MLYCKLATYYRPRFYADVSQMPFDSNLIYIYISNVVALKETLYSRCLHFSMKNIEQSRDLTRALGGLALTTANVCLCLSCLCDVIIVSP